jgi:hypothetical protein
MRRRRHPPLPPGDVANLCEVHSWDDDINDGARKALELAHHHIRRLAARAARCAMRAERIESQCERLTEDNRRMADYLRSLMRQKGGAA